MAKKNSMMLPLLLGGGALAAWYFYFRNPAAAAPVTASPAGVPPSLNSPLTPTTLPGTIPMQTGISSTATGNPSVVQNNSNIAITSWANSGALSPANRNQLFSQLPNMSPADTNELADIIVNVWGKGLTPSADQVAWWNTWRTTYHVDDDTYQ